jgi:bacteriocin-like protein
LKRAVTYLFKNSEIRALYINYSEESDFNGFKVLDIDKLANVIGYFAQFIDNLYKVKPKKLLWYAECDLL